MGSLTVRQLDDKLKKLLRLRAARHSRSMEDEVRVILREAAEQTDSLDDFEPPSQRGSKRARLKRTATASCSSSAAASPPINRST